MKMILPFAILALLAVPCAAGEDVPAQQKRLFLSGRQHFDLGELTDALKDFKEGYRLNDDPVFLYNIAQCERLLGHDNEALRAYQAYLQRLPDASNRDEVEHKIGALKEAIATHKEAGSKPPNHVVSPEPAANAPASPSVAVTRAAERKPVYKKWWLWTTIAVVAVAGAGVGLGIGLSRSSGTTYPAVQF